MKWLTFISCLFLVSVAQSNPRRARDAGHTETLKHYADIDDRDFGAILLALYSQSAQEATLDEVRKLVYDSLLLRRKCAADEHSDPKCTKHLHEVFLDEICHEEGFAAKHGFTECCAKAGEERNKCIQAHKNDSAGFIPPFQKPDAEVACKNFHDDENVTLARYIYEVARRNPFADVTSIVRAAPRYRKLMETCCAAEAKEACFSEKAPEVKKQLKQELALQRIACSILKKLGKEPLMGAKIVAISQRFPKADFPTVLKLANDITHVYEEGCSGDTLESLLDRSEVADYACSHKNSLSSKIDDCCNGPKLHRSECLAHVENDDRPADLSERVEEFIQKEACQHYTEDKTQHLNRFLYEYGRRHPEYSHQLIIRLKKGYQDLLDKCCADEHPEQCLPQGEEQLKKHIQETLAVVNANCELHDKLGHDSFQNAIIVRYTKKAPQLSFEDLSKYALALGRIADKCCHLNASHKLVCAEENTFLVIGKICEQHLHSPINAQVCKCCSDSYASRLECFVGLGADPTYVPVPFTAEIDDDLCSATAEELKTKKQQLLVSLVKHKPDITPEQLQAITAEFLNLLKNCCTAENRDTCFHDEGQKLIEKAKVTLGEE